MSSSDGSSGSGSSGSSEAEDEQHVPQVVTGANADPQVLQYFWDLASLQQVSYDPICSSDTVCPANDAFWASF